MVWSVNAGVAEVYAKVGPYYFAIVVGGCAAVAELEVCRVHVLVYSEFKGHNNVGCTGSVYLVAREGPLSVV